MSQALSSIPTISKIQKLFPEVIWTLSSKEGVDFTTNYCMSHAKKLNKTPQELAVSIIDQIKSNKITSIINIEFKSPGFINIVIDPKELLSIWDYSYKTAYPQNLIIEYGHANYGKKPHVGHLFNYIIGKSMAEFYDKIGHKVYQTSYRSDIGIGLAAAVYGWRQLGKPTSDDIEIQGDIAQKSYELGATLSKENLKVAEEIKLLNDAIFKGNTEALPDYQFILQYSANYLKHLHKVLEIEFYEDIPESKMVNSAKAICDDALKQGIFREDAGAIIFDKEQSGLHTRVFINSFGNPTYEAKELALAEYYQQIIPEHDKHIVIAQNEITEYFKVLKRALELLFPQLAPKCLFIPTGHLSTTAKKMSSRKGGTLSGLDLINEIKSIVKASDVKNIMDDDSIHKVALAALSFSFASKNINQNQILDLHKASNFHGATGPYLQYSLIRLQSLLTRHSKIKKGHANHQRLHDLSIAKIALDTCIELSEQQYNLAPFANQLYEFASLINKWYEDNNINTSEKSHQSELITEAHLLYASLYHYINLLGIKVPNQM